MIAKVRRDMKFRAEVKRIVLASALAASPGISQAGASSLAWWEVLKTLSSLVVRAGNGNVTVAQAQAPSNADHAGDTIRKPFFPDDFTS